MTLMVNMPAVSFTNFSVSYKQFKLGEITSSVFRPIEMKDEEDYDLVTVKRRNVGIVERGVFKGKEVKVKSQFKIEAGDFLISKRQIIHGACEIVPSNLDGAIVSNEYHILHGNEDLLLTEYLNLLSKLPKMKNYFALACVGVDIEKMLFRIEDWKKRKVMIPSIEEQQKIASFFKLINKKIEKQQEKIEKLAQLKKGLMQKVFSQELRFKDESEMDFPDWKEKKLGEIGTFRTSSVNKLIDENENEVFLVNYMDVYRHTRIDLSNYKQLQKVTAKEGQFSVNNLQKGDMLFTPSSETPEDIGHSIVIPEDLPNTLFSYHLLRFRPNNKIQLDNGYSHYFCNTAKVRDQIIKIATGSTRFTVSKSDFSNITIDLPTNSEQQKIAEFLSNVSIKIEFEKEKLTYLQEQKKGFMQRMFV